MRNKIFTKIILTTLMCALLTLNVGRVTRVSAMAIGPIADPVFETEIIAFKDYVEQNLDNPQLDIMFFLIGGLAVAQMGAQDAMLKYPYPNEQNVKEWIINCGVQLYNSVIGLVPEGDYYMGIPSIGGPVQKGVPRQVIKGLVAQMMGDAVVAANYPTLDDFLEDNPDEIYLPFNADLQLGVNAIFGLNNGLGSWQLSTDIDASFTWRTETISNRDLYNTYVASLTYRTPFNYGYSGSYNSVVNFDTNIFNTYHNIFVRPDNYTFTFYDDNGNAINTNLSFPISFVTTSGSYVGMASFNSYYSSGNYSSSMSKEDVIRNIYNGTLPFFFWNMLSTEPIWFSVPALLSQHVDFDFYYGTDWAHRIQFEVTRDLNLDDTDMSPYYNQLTSDYLFDIRGLISDLVGVTDIFNQIKDNLYDLTGILQLNPDFINVSVELPDISLLVDPPVPVNLNDFALYTENDYLEEIRDRSEKFGETIGEYFVFWHNADPATVYVIFGSVIVILLGAFVGKLGHS